MPQPPRILAFAGSLRSGSWNKKLVKVAIKGAEAAGARVTYVDLKELPMPIYDGDLEAAEGLPANAVKLRQIMLESDGLLLSCPEYNSSISAALKNAIDWASRPDPKQPGGGPPLACFAGKVAALMSASTGALGGLRGLVTVRSILGNIKVIVLPEQVAVSKADAAFNDDGSLKDAKQQASIEALGSTLAKTIAKLRG